MSRPAPARGGPARPEALARMLAQAADQGLPPVTWIASDEDLLRQEAADAVRARARAIGFDERVVFHAERGFKLDTLLAETRSLSLFSGQRLLELRIAGKPGKELGEGVADALESLPPETRLLVSSPRLDRATSESAWFGRIASRGLAVALPGVDRTRLPAWIGERLARQGQQADARTLALIAERVEGNLLAADQEVRKLGLLFAPGALPADAVRAAVLDVARWDAFDLVDAALAADVSRALRCLHGLRAEGTAVPVVLWALADIIRSLVRLSHRARTGQALAPALRSLRIWGERERLVPIALRRLSASRLQALMQACARVDRITKGLGAGDDWQALETLVMGLAGAPALELDMRSALPA